VIGDWRTRAACRNADPDIFYPPEDVAASSATYRPARAICRACDVRRQCLQEELKFAEWQQHGVRGGLTAKQRIAILRRRNGTSVDQPCTAKRHGDASAYKRGCRCGDARDDMRLRYWRKAHRPRRPQIGFDPQAVERALSGDRKVVLTVAEMREAVRQLLSYRLTSQQIADRLGVSQRTVSRHRSALRRGLEPCGTRSALMRHLAHGEEPCAACAKLADQEAA
jgi:WhiB family redox-sensing transcriptional regulator